jgi:UDP-N-acetylglucosamine 1-carboxyvinyltransferase
LAGLAADGQTVVAPGYLIDRGHASVASRLATLGADIVSEVVSERSRQLAQSLASPVLG